MANQALKVLKVQATASGYTAWAIRELMRLTQQSPAEIEKMALDRWVTFDREYLEAYGITNERFIAEVVEQSVVPLKR